MEKRMGFYPRSPLPTPLFSSEFTALQFQADSPGGQTSKAQHHSRLDRSTKPTVKPAPNCLPHPRERIGAGEASEKPEAGHEKEAFIISQLKAKGLTLRDEKGRRRALDSEEMAVFYKSFLDKNRVRHANYNKEWYRRNFTITLLMARVALRSLWKTVSKKKNGSPAT
ncbi:unnamed protein product [Menidia menidia]|uniref:(Atlantic silverside) hypothetical protein n=1 Tax=Menidia menidia TaxID=238744 RepID=A0A8S4AIZ4_9TELE|nr:unnamed protein product [Menidia menidia]